MNSTALTSIPKETLVFGAGCFWGAQELIRQVGGVLETEVGFSGGTLKDPTYKEVCGGDTGHAEAVRVVFDPSKVSLAHLLDLFFDLHDPTTLNQQGGDRGTQYRSVIFYSSESQRAEAEQAIARAFEKWGKPITTQLQAFEIFYSASEEHQDYLQKHPEGYTCHYWRNQTPNTQPHQ